MNYNEFTKTVREFLSAKLNPSYEIIIKKVAKNNDVYRYGISAFPKGDNGSKKISRIVYLEDFYKEYEEENCQLENIVNELCYVLIECDSPKFNEADYTDINKVRDRIIFELVNYEKNEKRLLDRPYIKVMDLAIIFAFVATDLGKDFGIVHITNEMAKQFGLTKDELWNISKINTPKLLKADVMSMSSFIPDEDINDEEEMYILCNNKKTSGAGVILYDKILEELSSKLSSDLYILPSSIHETIIIRADENKDIYALQEMVKNINNTVVSEEDILSDKVYHYVRKSKELKMV